MNHNHNESAIVIKKICRYSYNLVFHKEHNEFHILYIDFKGTITIFIYKHSMTMIYYNYKEPYVRWIEKKLMNQTRLAIYS